MSQADVLGLAKLDWIGYRHVLLQLSFPRRQVQLCNPSLQGKGKYLSLGCECQAPGSGKVAKDMRGKIQVHVFRQSVRRVNGMNSSNRKCEPLMVHHKLTEVHRLREGREAKSHCYLSTYNTVFLINYYAVFHAYASPVTTFEWKPSGIMEISAHTSIEFVTNAIGTLYKTKSTLSWIAHLKI
eukprot:1154033-Pelagomonas_calceolata.AAC.1